jgi:16S rRNA processing protein RimM
VPRLEVGRVAKAHGLRGEVVIVPITNQPARFEAGVKLWHGERALEIVTSRPHQAAYLVHFAGFDDRNAAETLRGATLAAESLADAPPGEIWVHELIGAEVRDRGGAVIGRVASVEANPAHDLLVLEGGELIPMVFVVDHAAGVVTVDLPDGLLDL